MILRGEARTTQMISEDYTPSGSESFILLSRNSR